MSTALVGPRSTQRDPFPVSSSGTLRAQTTSSACGGGWPNLHEGPPCPAMGEWSKGGCGACQSRSWPCPRDAVVLRHVGQAMATAATVWLWAPAVGRGERHSSAHGCPKLLLPNTSELCDSLDIRTLPFPLIRCCYKAQNSCVKKA